MARKKKITFTQLCGLALLEWEDNFYKHRAVLTELANKQVKLQLTKEQADKLWARFEQLYLVEIYLNAFGKFKGKHDPKEISLTIYTVYLSHLMQQRGMNREQGLDFIAKNKFKYADNLLTDIMNKAVADGVNDFKSDNLVDVLNTAIREFCTSFHFYDVPNEAVDIHDEGIFDSEMIAFKLVQPSVAVVQSLFNQYRITWDLLLDLASSPS